MSPFYFDLTVEYMHAASKINHYTPEDISIISDIAGKKYKLVIINF